MGVFNWWLSLQPLAHAGVSLVDFSTLKIEAIRSSETSVHTRSTWRHIPEDSILQCDYSFPVDAAPILRAELTVEAAWTGE
jgi:hypothetical protein